MAMADETESVRCASNAAEQSNAREDRLVRAKSILLTIKHPPMRFTLPR
jgi:hypothetical protein